MDCKDIQMKTTLVISDEVMERLRQEAAKQGRTMSELVEAAVRVMLEPPERPRPLPPLPVFSTGGARVNVADREALYRVMEH
jgi:hypothetical protein